MQVAITRVRRLARCRELLERILPHGLQHAETRLAVRLADH